MVTLRLFEPQGSLAAATGAAVRAPALGNIS